MPNGYRKTKHPRFPMILVIILAVIAVICIVLILALRKPTSTVPGGERSETEPSVSTTEPTVTDPSSADPAVTDPPVTTSPTDVTAQLPREQIHAGSLILVNYANEYHFPEKDTLMPFYGNKTASYKLAYSDIEVKRDALDAFNALMAEFNRLTGVGDILIVSGFRDYESQKEVYTERVEEQGIAEADKYVAKPGFSEHHTGYAVDLTVYADDGTSSRIQDLPSYGQFVETAARFGFVLRYQPEKIAQTKIYGEEWHFRYVGVPHAYYMKVKNLCLEEYISVLRAFPYNGSHLNFADEDGQSWEIYYVPADPNAETVSVPVPTDAPYSVSGNNADGFIVTVSR